jgi:hypothetical protein
MVITAAKLYKTVFTGVQPNPKKLIEGADGYDGPAALAQGLTLCYDSWTRRGAM